MKQKVYFKIKQYYQQYMAELIYQKREKQKL